MTQSDLQAGIARAVVTPPVGIPMSGFAGRGPATGVHDDLYATAMVLEAGGVKAAIVAADLVAFPDEFTAKVRSEAERRTGIPAPHLFLCASHTHYGPVTTAYESEGLSDDVTAYLGNLVHLLAGAVQEAPANTQPVRMGVGRGESDIGINRRERKPDGVIVLSIISLLTFDADRLRARWTAEWGLVIGASSGLVWSILTA